MGFFHGIWLFYLIENIFAAHYKCEKTLKTLVFLFHFCWIMLIHSFTWPRLSHFILLTHLWSVQMIEVGRGRRQAFISFLYRMIHHNNYSLLFTKFIKSTQFLVIHYLSCQAAKSIPSGLYLSDWWMLLKCELFGDHNYCFARTEWIIHW